MCFESPWITITNVHREGGRLLNVSSCADRFLLIGVLQYVEVGVHPKGSIPAVNHGLLPCITVDSQLPAG